MIRDNLEVLEKLFHLNHWAKTRDVITRRDRDVIYSIKREGIRRLTERGILSPTRRIERPHRTLNELKESRWEGIDLLEQAVMSFQNDSRGLDDTAMIQSIDAIYYAAIASRQPMSVHELESLGIPADTFALSVGMNADIDADWGDNPGAIDPCWYWLVEFSTQDPLPRFCFHLPLRVAESFCEIADTATSDKDRPSGEYGERFGRPIMEEESLAFPIMDLVTFFGRNESDFPNRLRTRDEIEDEIAQSWSASYQADRCDEDGCDEDNWGEDDWGEDDWDEDDWDEACE